MNKTISVALAFCSALALHAATITYQGRLSTGGSLASGDFEMEFRLYDSHVNGTCISTSTIPSVAVTNGLFTALPDFDAKVFNGDSRWLEISVKSGVDEIFSTLMPRQQITATPYAITALNVSGNNSEPSSSDWDFEFKFHTVPDGRFDPTEYGISLVYGAPSTIEQRELVSNSLHIVNGALTVKKESGAPNPGPYYLLFTNKTRILGMEYEGISNTNGANTPNPSYARENYLILGTKPLDRGDGTYALPGPNYHNRYDITEMVLNLNSNGLSAYTGEEHLGRTNTIGMFTSGPERNQFRDSPGAKTVSGFQFVNERTVVMYHMGRYLVSRGDYLTNFTMTTNAVHCWLESYMSPSTTNFGHQFDVRSFRIASKYRMLWPDSEDAPELFQKNVTPHPASSKPIE
jgi:hypothetical protein